MAGFYEGRSVIVTGGSGFLGSYVVEELISAKAKVRVVGRKAPPHPVEGAEYIVADLRREEECMRALGGAEFVFHLAAVGWGLQENMSRQPELLTQNLLLNTTVLDAAFRLGVERYLHTSSSAVYPGRLQELDEDAPWDGPPDASEAAFGWAKRIGEVQASTYWESYGFPVAIVRPANPYGPRDNFDPAKSHVIPALIRRALQRETPLRVWGTGKPIRSFVFAGDVARGMLLALEKYAVGRPVNLASHETTSIEELVRLVLEMAGFDEAEVIFDKSKPDGHPRKVPSVERAARELGMVDYVPLREGLMKTIDWFRTEGSRRV